MEAEDLHLENPFNPPTFRFTFTKGYIEKPTINIPLPFARAHFNRLKGEIPVRLFINQLWKGTMRITRDKHNNIVSCSVKKGIPQMIAGEGIKLDDKPRISMEGGIALPIFYGSDVIEGSDTDDDGYEYF